MGSDSPIAGNDIALAQRARRGSGTGVADRERAREWAIPLRCVWLPRIAMPIGSTAYSYAVGPPRVPPMLDAVVISPVAPISGIPKLL